MVPPPPDAPAGSFFNTVPDDNDNEKDDESPDIDEQVTELLRNRKKPAMASERSTINGVPTEKATGFGKIKGEDKKPAASKKPYVAIGPQAPEDKPLNDPTNVEYDDQGYTLYADEETGKKTRVFEALVDYPCDFVMKIVGANEGTFVEEMVAVVAESCGAEPGSIQHSVKTHGKWTSVTVNAPVKSAEMLYTLYEKVDLDPRVKFKF